MQHSNSKKAEIIISTVARLLREERIKQNKSQRILADEYDIQRSLISRMESGQNEPMLVSLWSICEALGLKTSDFLEKVEQNTSQMTFHNMITSFILCEFA